MSYKTQSLLLVLLLGLASSALAQAQNPFIGTWDIDLRESNFGSATPPANMSRTYFDHGDGSYTYMVITTAQDGSLSGSTANYSYDGELYPIANFDQNPEATISYTQINDTTVEYRVYLDGELSQIGAKYISPNHQHLTISIQYPGTGQENQILLFNKRN